LDSCILEIGCLDTAELENKGKGVLPIQKKVLRSFNLPTTLFALAPVSCQFCSGCILVATKVTAEVDMSPVVIGLIPLKAMVFADQSCCMPSRSFFRFADLTMLIERPT